VTVLLPNQEFERLDRYCDERGYKKSTLIQRLVKEHLDRQGFAVQSKLFGGRKANEGGS